MNMHYLANIVKFTGAFLILGDLWTAFVKRNLEQLYVYIFMIIPGCAITVLLLLSEVDRFAGLWGVHVWWKLIPGAIIFALFLPIVMIGYRRIPSNWDKWLAILDLILIFSASLYFVLTDWAAFPAVSDISSEAYQVFPWLADHPSLAIHHLYANATLLGALEMLWLVPVFGKALATRAGRLLGNQRRAVGMSSLIFAAGWILDIISSRT